LVKTKVSFEFCSTVDGASLEVKNSLKSHLTIARASL
jgi:hypothetical protein